jgi:acyl-CoA thioester hydrolase
MVVTTRMELRWRDLDMLGHLNQAVYHEYLEEARSAWMLSVEGLEWAGFVLAHVDLDYRHEVRKSDGHVDIAVRPQRVGRSSVTLRHDLLLPDGTLAASGTSVLVGWDGERRRSRPFGEAERAALASTLEGDVQSSTTASSPTD